jgi:hypothetical protein
MGFALAITQVIQTATEGPNPGFEDRLLGHRNCFLFSAASAAVGFAVVACSVRVPRECLQSEGDEGEKVGDLEC